MVAEAQVGAALCCRLTRHKIRAEESQLLTGVGAQSPWLVFFFSGGEGVPGLVSPLSGTRVPPLKTLTSTRSVFGSECTRPGLSPSSLNVICLCRFVGSPARQCWPKDAAPRASF